LKTKEILKERLIEKFPILRGRLLKQTPIGRLRPFGKFPILRGRLLKNFRNVYNVGRK